MMIHTFWEVVELFNPRPPPPPSKNVKIHYWQINVIFCTLHKIHKMMHILEIGLNLIEKRNKIKVEIAKIVKI